MTVAAGQQMSKLCVCCGSGPIPILHMSLLEASFPKFTFFLMEQYPSKLYSHSCGSASSHQILYLLGGQHNRTHTCWCGSIPIQILYLIIKANCTYVVLSQSGPCPSKIYHGCSWSGSLETTQPMLLLINLYSDSMFVAVGRCKNKLYHCCCGSTRSSVQCLFFVVQPPSTLYGCCHGLAATNFYNGSMPIQTLCLLQLVNAHAFLRLLLWVGRTCNTLIASPKYKPPPQPP